MILLNELEKTGFPFFYKQRRYILFILSKPNRAYYQGTFAHKWMSNLLFNKEDQEEYLLLPRSCHSYFLLVLNIISLSLFFFS